MSRNLVGCSRWDKSCKLLEISRAIDKAQADLQKLLSGEKQKVSKLSAAISG